MQIVYILYLKYKTLSELLDLSTPCKSYNVAEPSVQSFYYLTRVSILATIKTEHCPVSKLICINLTYLTFCDTQLCGRCLVNMTPVVKVVIHCVLNFALL